MSERLTMDTPCGYVECDPIDIYTDDCYSEENFEKIIEKLGTYEDLEEEGRLIKLPCAIGDKLFFIKKLGEEKLIVERKVVGFSIEETGTWIAYGKRKIDNKIYRHNIKADDIGKAVFLTKEAAEAALKEREQE